jgi:hypothetical protein
VSSKLDVLEFMEEMIPEIENRVAAAMAKKRTGNSVYMDGSHQPNPSEKRLGRDIGDYIRYFINEKLDEMD